jgi:hypothetical protein
MSAPVPERGKLFPLSIWRVALRSLAFFLALVFGLLVAYVGFAIIRAELAMGQHRRWALLFACGVPILLVGLAICGTMAVVQGNLLYNLVLGERLLVGERAFQRLTRGGRILSHIPYDNIASVRVFDVMEQRGAHKIAVRKVAILVEDEAAPGTVLSSTTSFSPGKHSGEYYIEPVYRASIDQIGQALIKRWRAHQEQDETEEESEGP